MAAPGDALRRRRQQPPPPPREEGAAEEAGGPVPSQMQQPSAGTFWLTRLALLRATAFIYFVAFLVAYHQNKGLIGERGLLPCKLYLENIKRYCKGKINLEALSYAPTLFWFLDWSSMDITLDSFALMGLAISAFILVTGCANVVLMATLWALYLSLVNVGQVWLAASTLLSCLHIFLSCLDCLLGRGPGLPFVRLWPAC